MLEVLVFFFLLGGLPYFPLYSLELLFCWSLCADLLLCYMLKHFSLYLHACDFTGDRMLIALLLLLLVVVFCFLFNRVQWV